MGSLIKPSKIKFDKNNQLLKLNINWLSHHCILKSCGTCHSSTLKQYSDYNSLQTEYTYTYGLAMESLYKNIKDLA